MTTKKLTRRQRILVATTLFGMFFGAGNLIFPVHLGQMAGSNVIPAIIGFIITAVGIPIFGVAAIGVTHSDGLQTLSGKVGKGYGIFFTCLLYLTIGPLFAIPRCAATSFTVGVTPLVTGSATLAQAIFTTVFFALALYFSLKPSKIMDSVGKLLNPIFLVLLGVLVIRALISPMGDIQAIEATGEYITQPFFKGFLEGYNTMDALAALAFGIVVVNVIKRLGISDPGAVARNTASAGIFSCLLMALIYLAVTIVGTQSRALYEAGANGGEVLAIIAKHYFGTAGTIVLAAIVTFACLKTAIGLITSCAETFEKMFKNGPSYRVWAILFCIVSLLIANMGLSAIIAYSVPMLMLLYPLAITLILLALFGRFFNHSRTVYAWVTGLTLIAAVVDFMGALPTSVYEALHLDVIVHAVNRVLPFSGIGLGWICPALLGLVIGIVSYIASGKRQRKAA